MNVRGIYFIEFLISDICFYIEIEYENSHRMIALLFFANSLFCIIEDLSYCLLRSVYEKSF